VPEFPGVTVDNEADLEEVRDVFGRHMGSGSETKKPAPTRWIWAQLKVVAQGTQEVRELHARNPRVEVEVKEARGLLASRTTSARPESPTPRPKARMRSRFLRATARSFVPSECLTRCCQAPSIKTV
jgi:hypothetical protein